MGALAALEAYTEDVGETALSHGKLRVALAVFETLNRPDRVLDVLCKHTNPPDWERAQRVAEAAQQQDVWRQLARLQSSRLREVIRSEPGPWRLLRDWIVALRQGKCSALDDCEEVNEVFRLAQAQPGSLDLSDHPLWLSTLAEYTLYAHETDQKELDSAQLMALEVHRLEQARRAQEAQAALQAKEAALKAREEEYARRLAEQEEARRRLEEEGQRQREALQAEREEQERRERLRRLRLEQERAADWQRQQEVERLAVLERYREKLKTATSDNLITPEEARDLEAFRKTHKVTEEEHTQVLKTLSLMPMQYDQFVEQGAKPLVPADTKDEGKTCRLCEDNSRDCVIYPCGHALGCQACVAQHRAANGSHCPWCRMPIKEVRKVYLD